MYCWGAEDMTERNVWIFIEQDGGKIAEISLELLAKGQELAQILGSQVWALLCGHEVGALAESSNPVWSGPCAGG